MNGIDKGIWTIIMNKITLILTILVVTTTVYSQTKVNINNLVLYGDKWFKENDDKPFTGIVFDLSKETGEKILYSKYFDGKANGIHKEYWIDGGKKVNGRYNSGLMNGRWSYWYENGKKKEEVTYQDNIKDGISTKWDESGIIRIKGKFKKGQKDGLWSAWYRNGAKSNIVYLEGVILSQKFYNEAGEEVPMVQISNKYGNIILELYPQVAPAHVSSFIEHVKNQYYKGTTFHRVIPGFVIQGGDPNSKSDDRSMHGMGGHAAKYFGVGNEDDSTSWMLPAEFNDSLHTRGILSMARAQDPNSGGSQFFICVADVPQLDHQYTVFGKVVQGMEYVDTIVNLPRDNRDNPNDRIEIDISFPYGSMRRISSASKTK
jgi:peptidyl-prolyl cis-trans isomerase B (cyclophilin B)